MRKVPIKIINENLIRQVLRSATSIGANYNEANGAISKADFKQKVFICKKEAKETLYWFELLKETLVEEDQKELVNIMAESKELMLIFSKITVSLKN